MSNLPIRRVVLYKHGVGYFERETQIEGDQSLSLSFKQREVSDVLKSLTVLDLDGGTVSAVSYDSTTPIEQLLADLGADWQRTSTALTLLEVLPPTSIHELLQLLANGDPDSRLTREAKAMLERVPKPEHQPKP